MDELEGGSRPTVEGRGQLGLRPERERTTLAAWAGGLAMSQAYLAIGPCMVRGGWASWEKREGEVALGQLKEDEGNWAGGRGDE